MLKVIGIASAFVLTVCVVATLASPAIGVTPTLLARGTYDAFKVKTSPFGPIDVNIKTTTPVDIVVRQHDYAVDSTTGWHTHPGPVFITVLEGEVTFYEYDDPNCTPKIVRAGEGYVDTGHGHIGRNETDEPAEDMTVILAPPGEPFRGELDAPNPYCGF